MTYANEVAPVLLASVTAGMQNGDGNTTVYTVPAGKVLQVFFVKIRNPTASLADGTDYDFGDSGGGNYINAAAVNLTTMTASTHYWTVSALGALQTEFAAGVDFEVVVNTGATLDADATVELYGILRDA